MADMRTQDVTALLLQWRDGDAAAAEISACYTELNGSRSVAAAGVPDTCFRRPRS